MNPENFSEARYHALRKHQEAAEKIPAEEVIKQYQLSENDPEFAYIFGLQVEIESEGEMDYHKFARRAWQDVLKGDPRQSSPEFESFENNMISGLHKIPMREARLRYPSKESFQRLGEKYADNIDKLIMWSSGDTESTGYQPGKISRSRVIEDFYKGLTETKGREGAKQFMKDKTSYMVGGDKLGRLREYILALQAKDPKGKVKIVVLEDLRRNLQEASKIAAEFDPTKVEFVPIWATYSREGQKLRTKSTAEFIQAKQRLNGIDSFEELGDEPQFAEKLDGAHVFIDFDGVISNNIEMRREQAAAIYSALLHGVSKALGKSPEEVIPLIRKSIETINQGQA